MKVTRVLTATLLAIVLLLTFAATAFAGPGAPAKFDVRTGHLTDGTTPVYGKRYLVVDNTALCRSLDMDPAWFGDGAKCHGFTWNNLDLETQAVISTIYELGIRMHSIRCWSFIVSPNDFFTFEVVPIDHGPTTIEFVDKFHEVFRFCPTKATSGPYKLYY